MRRYLVESYILAVDQHILPIPNLPHLPSFPLPNHGHLHINFQLLYAIEVSLDDVRPVFVYLNIKVT